MSADRFADLPAVNSARRELDGFSLTVAEPHVALPALLAKLHDDKLELARLTTRHASLEDVFVTLMFGGLPSPLAGLYGNVAQLRLVNGYGLFAVMTTTRPEIVIEGSDDGLTWLPYVFQYKTQAVDEAPQWVAPYQPRLDWQMWFAALGGPRQQPWIVNLCVRLLEGSPEVLALLRENPFPDGPPRYLRAQLYQYEFTEWGDALVPETDWWRREYLGVYLEPFSLR